jgi:4-hydroxybenzoate polyprenyltransferase
VFVLPGIAIPLTVLKSWPDAALLSRMVLGIVSVGLIASSNYVINEVLDGTYDRLHPTKSSRPVAQGRVLLPLAYVQWIAVMMIGLLAASHVNRSFMITLGILWVMGCIYNIPPVRTKNVPFLDVLSESVNNPLRLLAGWYIVGEQLVPPLSLLLAYWMVGGYFMALKRFGEFRDIGNQTLAAKYRPSFRSYSERSLLVSAMFYGSAGMLFFGAFIMRYRMELVLAFPAVALVMAIYLHLAFEPESVVVNPEKLYKEPRLIVSIAACVFVIAVLLRYDIPALHRIFVPTLPVAGG